MPLFNSSHQLALLELLRNSALFKHIEDKVLEPIINQAHQFRFEKNKLLIINSTESEHFHIIEQGRVMLSRPTIDGNLSVIDILTRGGAFGITNLFKDKIDYDFLAETVEASVLWRIPINILRKLVHQENQFTQNLLCLNLTTRIFQEAELEHQALQNASQKLACFLLSQCVGIDQYPVTINLPYSKKIISARLRIRQETFSRALQIVQNETGARMNGSKLIVEDILSLRTYACQNCSLTFPCHYSNTVNRIY